MTDPRWLWIASLLACPACQLDLDVAESPSGAAGACRGCGAQFGLITATGVLDLRCPRPKTHVLNVKTGGTAYGDALQRVTKGPPPVTYTHPLPSRVSPELVSLIKDTVAPGGVIIEVGGSSGSYREPVLGLGYRFVTSDYESPNADLLADAHALPFRTACADAVLMQGVSQAFENPFVAFGEIARVLKGDGRVLGTTDCCAVFASSFFNITPWGLLSALQASGLVPHRLWVIKDALEFCGTNPGYPAIVKPVLRVLSRLSRLPVLTPRNLVHRRRADPLITAGSLAFVATKRP